MAAKKKASKKAKTAKKTKARKAKTKPGKARADQANHVESEEAPEDLAPSLAPEIPGVHASRPVIAPLPSLPEPSADEEVEEKPVLRLAGDRQIGGQPLLRHGPGSGPAATPLKRGIPMPEEHAPRQLLGDAALLFDLARHDRAEDMRRLIENGADPNLSDDPGNVHREAVSFMCQNEDIGENNLDGIKFGRTACHMAAVRGHTNVLLALVQGGCNVNVVDHAGKAPLMRAARMGFLEATSLLVQAGADVNARDLRQSTALLRAADSGHADVVRLLTQAGADVNLQDCEGRTALIVACAGVHAETVRVLLEAKADVRLRDATALDALTAAIDAVEPSDPNAPSPFHVVREEQLLPVVSLLLQSGLRDEPDEAGVWPSQRAEERGHPNVAALLRGQAS